MKKITDWVYENRAFMSIRLRKLLLQDPSLKANEGVLPYYEYVEDINILQIKNIKNIGTVTIYELEELLYQYRQKLDLALIDERLETTLNSRLKKVYISNKESIQMGIISKKTLKQSFKLGIFACMDLLGDQIDRDFSNRLKKKISDEYV